MVRNRILAKQISALRVDSARALEDDGLMAQLETASVAGSALATRLLAASAPSARVHELPTSSVQTAKADDGDFIFDFNACTHGAERMSVLRRWHVKGYVFSREQRRAFIKGATDSGVREEMRRMFDEQDDWPNARLRAIAGLDKTIP